MHTPHPEYRRPPQGTPPIAPPPVDRRHEVGFHEVQTLRPPQGGPELIYTPLVSGPIVLNMTQTQNAYPAHQVVRQERRWSPFLAFILSLFCPGLGQAYKGNLAGGLLWFIFVPLGYCIFIIPGLLLHFCCLIGATTLPAEPL